MNKKNSRTTAVKNTKEAVEKVESLKVEQSMDKAVDTIKDWTKKQWKDN